MTTKSRVSFYTMSAHSTTIFLQVLHFQNNFFINKPVQLNVINIKRKISNIFRT